MEKIQQQPGEPAQEALDLSGPNGETCMECRYVLVVPGAAFCRRKPPEIHHIDVVPVGPVTHRGNQRGRLNPHSFSPPINPAAWCGEWTPADRDGDAQIKPGPAAVASGRLVTR